MLFAAHFLLVAMRNSPHYNAAWSYFAAPLVSPGRFRRGSRKAILAYIVVPTFLLLFVLYVTQMEFSHAVLHTVFIYYSMQMYFSLLSLFERDMPLSRRDEKFETANRIVRLFIAIPFFAILGVVQYFAYQEILWTVISVVLMAMAAYTVDRLSIRRFDKIIATQAVG
jgi:cobalamin synthase